MIADLLQVPVSSYCKLNSKLNCIIQKNNFVVPPSLLNFLPELNNWIQGIMVVKKRHDQNIWCPTANGNLTLKRAYLHLPGNSRKLHWVNFIWNMGIPDSVSMLI